VGIPASLLKHLVKPMLPLLISLFRRKPTYAWSPAIDLSDPYIAAALTPVSYS
jgi:hypothetical protein